MNPADLPATYDDQLTLPLAVIAGQAQSWLSLHFEALAREEGGNLDLPATTWEDLSALHAVGDQLRDVINAVSRRPGMAAWRAQMFEAAEEIAGAALRLDDVGLAMPGYGTKVERALES